MGADRRWLDLAVLHRGDATDPASAAVQGPGPQRVGTAGNEPPAARIHCARHHRAVVAQGGQWIVTTGTDRTARVWDAGTGEQQADIWTDTETGPCCWIGTSQFVVGSSKYFHA